MGPRGPKRRKTPALWDLTTEFFWCARCGVRYYQAGSSGLAMRCKRGDLCPASPIVRRRDAVRAVCRALAEFLRRDDALTAEVVRRARQIDAQGDEALQANVASLERDIAGLTNRVNDLLELAGHGTDQDRQETKARLQAAQVQRAAARAELARVRKALTATAVALTPERAREILADLAQLLEDAGGGRLGEDSVYRALAVFRELTGGRVWVHVEPRPGRKRPNVRGTFCPQVVRAVEREAEATLAGGDEPAPEVGVWLRPPPRLDLLAERVHQLVDVEGLSYVEAAETLSRDGRAVAASYVWTSHRRYHAMHGLPIPERPYNNGRPRRVRRPA